MKLYTALENVQWCLPDSDGNKCICPDCGRYEYEGHAKNCDIRIALETNHKPLEKQIVNAVKSIVHFAVVCKKKN